MKTKNLSYKICIFFLLINFQIDNARGYHQFEHNTYTMGQRSGFPNNSERPRKINGVAVPADFPALNVSINNTTSEGYLFLNNYNGNPYILIFKNDGTPYFYRKVEDRSREFKVNPGNFLSRRIRGETRGYLTMDSLYNPDHIWKCKAHETDDHEFQLTPEGTALMIGLDYMEWDLKDSIEGGKLTTVLGNVIQEIDREGNLLFEWHTKDHYSIKDTEGQSLTTPLVDYVHINSIAVDYDNHLVVSCRHLNECTKINRETGEIIWRFGGKNNQFDLINDEGFSYQHDFRPVPGKPGNYTVFDNGNLKQPDYSRAVEYKLDTSTMTATKVWEFSPDPALYSHWMGNVQRLPNGNTLVNFAEENLPKFIEVNPSGEVVYRANFEIPSQTYRSFRFKWNAVAEKPYLTIDRYPDMISLVYNKFGDKAVKSYNVYLSSQKGTKSLYANTSENWLNITMYDIPDKRMYYIRISAVYEDGSESQVSDEQEIYIDFVKPGENLIKNGDFTDGENFWELSLRNGAEASCGVNDKESYHFNIMQGGTNTADIQLRQEGISLVKDEEYLFEFSASSSSGRIIEAFIAKGTNPVIDLGKIGASYLPGPEKRFSYRFRMTENSEWEARLIINAGTEPGEFTMDEISLKQVTGTGIFDHNSRKDELNIFPNPASESFFLNFFSHDNEAKFLKIYDLSGNLIFESLLMNVYKGKNEIEISLNEIPGGMYLIQLKDKDSGEAFSVKKLLIK